MEVASFYAKDRQAWRNWLQQHHATEQAVWLIYDKGAQRTLSWEAIVQEALCFGWIDSRPGKVSETQSKLYISRRKPQSVWSKINKGYIELLTERGLMTSAGLQAVTVAKANGSWDALNRSDNLELPAELQAQLKKNLEANQKFQAFTPAAKRAILQWIYAAKTEATQTKRITQTVELAAQGQKPNQYDKR